MKRVMFVAGEASGDQHGAEIIKQLSHREYQCFGIGGKRMQQAGMTLLFDAAQIAVVGFIEVIKHFPAIRKAWKIAKHTIQERKPDLIVLIDYPGFNLRLAQYAKQQGIKVLYYISPQVWAWRQKRVHKIKRCVDHMAVIFPFEVNFYQKAGVPVSFVGSPLVEQVQSCGSQQAAQQQLKLPATFTYVGLLPGSRHSEIQRLLPTMVETAQQLKKHHPNIRFLLPIASTLKISDIEPYLADIKQDITLVEDSTYAAIEASDAVICSSGTATLETALLQVPLVVIYKTSALTFWLAKRLICIKNIALCNIVAGQKIVQEYLQQEANADNLQTEIDKLLTNDGYRAQVRKALSQVKDKLGQPGAADKVVTLIEQLVSHQN